MTKLETYMTGVHHSEPVFYVDIAVNLFDETGKKAMEELKEATLFVQSLGTYDASPARTDKSGFLPL